MEDPQRSLAERLPVGRITVLIQAPFPSVRRGLAAMLAEYDDVDSVTAAALPGEGPATAPDVIVSFVSSGETGQDVGVVGDEFTPILLIVEGMLAELPGLSSRPVGLLPAEVDAATLHSAVLSLSHGLSVVDATLASAAGISWRQPHAPHLNLPYQLTARESEVLNLVASGMPNKTIAAALGISEHTVKFHVGSILGKLGAESRTEAVTIATRQGMVVI